MARKPRKKKVKAVLRIEDLPLEEIESIVSHLKEKFPTSGQLITYEGELNKRASTRIE